MRPEWGVGGRRAAAGLAFTTALAAALPTTFDIDGGQQLVE